MTDCPLQTRPAPLLSTLATVATVAALPPARVQRPQRRARVRPPRRWRTRAAFPTRTLRLRERARRKTHSAKAQGRPSGDHLATFRKLLSHFHPGQRTALHDLHLPFALPDAGRTAETDEPWAALRRDPLVRGAGKDSVDVHIRAERRRDVEIPLPGAQSCERRWIDLAPRPAGRRESGRRRPSGRRGGRCRGGRSRRWWDRCRLGRR